jgi:integrase
MSAHWREDRGKWQVRWTDEAGRQRSKLFERKRDADIFDGKIKERKALGELALLDAGRETLDYYVGETYWRLTARNAERTKRENRRTYRLHIEPDLGPLPLRAIKLEVVERWYADLACGPHARGKAATLLGSILQRATEAGRIPRNPVRLLRKEQLPDSAEKILITPLQVEQMRRGADPRSAMVIAALAYAGLRPGELAIAEIHDIGESALLVHSPKTNRYKGRSRRYVDLLRPLRADIAEWRLRRGNPGPSEALIPGKDGGRWTHNAYKLWASRRFKEALERAGVDRRATPYSLRHSFASLLLHEGRSPSYVAAQLGHKPSLLLDHYGHDFGDLVARLGPRGQFSLEGAIREAREQVRTAATG